VGGDAKRKKLTDAAFVRGGAGGVCFWLWLTKLFLSRRSQC
jgi:hypothetical protein